MNIFFIETIEFQFAIINIELNKSMASYRTQVIILLI